MSGIRLVTSVVLLILLSSLALNAQSTGIQVKELSLANELPTVGGTGTAFVVHSDGYLLTNIHVVDNLKSDNMQIHGRELQVVLGEKSYKAQVLRRHPTRDLALLKIEAAGLAVTPLADSENVRLGEEARVLGYPLSSLAILGKSLKVTRGSIAGITQTPSGRMLQTDAGVNPGNSGGPLVNDRGNAVGVVKSIIDPTKGIIIGTNIGQCIPINEAKELLEAEGIELPKSEEGPELSGVELVERVQPAVARVEYKATHWTLSLDDVRDIALSSTGDLLAIAAVNGVVLYSLNAERRSSLIPFEDGTPYSLAFTPDERFIAIHVSPSDFLKRDKIIIWDVKHGRATDMFDTEFHEPRRLTFSPDGQFLVGATWSGITVWNRSNNWERKHYKSELVETVAVSPDGNMIASDRRDMMIQLRDIKTGRLLKAWDCIDTVKAISFSEDGRELITSHYGPTRVWNVNTTQLMSSLDQRSETVIPRHGKSPLLLHASNRSCSVYDSRDGMRLMHLLQDNSGSSVDVAISSENGRTFAVEHSDGKVSIVLLPLLLGQVRGKREAIGKLHKMECEVEFDPLGIRSRRLNRGVVELINEVTILDRLTFLSFEGDDIDTRILSDLKQTDSISSLKLMGPSISDASLKPVLALRDLAYLYLTNSQVTGYGLAQLVELKNLKFLYLNGCPIDDDGLRAVANLTTLTYLNLNRTQVSDESIVTLRKLQKLEGLMLHRTSTTDSILQQLTSLPRLISLSLGRDHITVRGVQHLHKLKALRHLTLRENVRNQDLAPLKDLPPLVSLAFWNSDLTDEALVHLRDLKGMDALSFDRTLLSESAVEELRRALPDTKIHWTPREPESPQP